MDESTKNGIIKAIILMVLGALVVVSIFLVITVWPMILVMVIVPVPSMMNAPLAGLG